MPNTYSQIYIQIVFAVKGRQNLISGNNKDELEKYISGYSPKARPENAVYIFNAGSYAHADWLKTINRYIRSGS